MIFNLCSTGCNFPTRFAIGERTSGNFRPCQWISRYHKQSLCEFSIPNIRKFHPNFAQTQHLALTAKSIYFVGENTTLPAVTTSIVSRLCIVYVDALRQTAFGIHLIDPCRSLPAHVLAILLFLMGFVGVFLHIINHRQRRHLVLTAVPGSIASTVALTSRSGFGELVLPYASLLFSCT